nr:MAG TPA: hypothetical protein [Caudoviricetes sp.]
MEIPVKRRNSIFLIVVANTRKINKFIIQKGKNSKPIGNLDCAISM